jgi:hypothetical protein
MFNASVIKTFAASESLPPLLPLFNPRFGIIHWMPQQNYLKNIEHVPACQLIM